MQRWLSRVWIVLRSGLVGGLATLVDFALLTALVEIGRLSPRAASVPPLLLGLALQFVGNKYFAFRDTSRDVASQGVRFFAVGLASIALTAAAFELLLHTGLHYLGCRVLSSSAAYLGFSLPLWSCIFRAKEIA